MEDNSCLAEAAYSALILSCNHILFPSSLIALSNNHLEAKLNELLVKTVGSDGQFRWDAVDILLRFLELRANFSKDTSSKYPEKCYVIFKQVFAFITPTEGLLITRFDGDRFTVACCCRSVHVALLFSRKDTLYKELLLNFIDDFIKNISKVFLFGFRHFRFTLGCSSLVVLKKKTIILELC
ncbi:unnamed protein product [Gongylonema pulchrum]|uniref:BTB/POZ domain-containing protein n=1 Tax=Gongylonema pulchrum TaxID=637853 RepID=A0A183DZ64_9BILA|nr:unnamed protein product [Gongylonema pulchrum]